MEDQEPYRKAINNFSKFELEVAKVTNITGEPEQINQFWYLPVDYSTKAGSTGHTKIKCVSKREAIAIYVGFSFIQDDKIEQAQPKSGKTQDYLLGLSKTDLRQFQREMMVDFNLSPQQIPDWIEQNSIEPAAWRNTF